MNLPNKILTCICCYSTACTVACCIDYWHAIEACGFADLECGACCWTICAPICHSCSIGDFGEGLNHCVNCLKYCGYACALQCCAPVDGCYNCVMYIGDIFGGGVTGMGDVLKNTKWIGNKIRGAFDFSESPQPVAKFSEYRP